MKRIEMARDAANELRESLIELAELHRNAKKMQDRANIALAKLETFVALIEEDEK